MRIHNTLAPAVLWLLGFGPLLHSAQMEYGLLVYGGTASGVITAVAGAREGLSVALLIPERHPGGVLTSGWAWNGDGRKDLIGGYALEFFQRAGKKYGQDVSWSPEPHVAEAVLKEMLDEAGVKVFYEHRLKEIGGVKFKGNRIKEIVVESGAIFSAAIFADCTYESDLMTKAGVAFAWGREAGRKYNESLAGIRPTDNSPQFGTKIRALDGKGNVLPEVSDRPKGEVGEGDMRVEAYSFHLVLSDNANNQVAIPMPAAYKPGRFTVLAQSLQEFSRRMGRAPRLEEMFRITRLDRGGKAVFENLGPFSLDYVGKNYEYPNASYKRRAEIWQEHADYSKGLLYFLAHDPQVPKSLQDETNHWGLAKDEFTDNENWPWQLVVREAHRTVGDFVLTQKDLELDPLKPDAIGMSAFPVDLHNVQRFINFDETVEDEGFTRASVRPFQIPYRVMLPKPSDGVNLLVPVAVSASHVAYSSVRPEPVLMVMGQAAGVAAKLTNSGTRSVQQIDLQALLSRLKEQGAVLESKQVSSR